MARPVTKPVESDEWKLTPAGVAGWMALFEGLRLINERGNADDESWEPCPGATEALIEYVLWRRDALMHAWFPNERK